MRNQTHGPITIRRSPATNAATVSAQTRSSRRRSSEFVQFPSRNTINRNAAGSCACSHTKSASFDTTTKSCDLANVAISISLALLKPRSATCRASWPCETSHRTRTCGNCSSTRNVGMRHRQQSLLRERCGVTQACRDIVRFEMRIVRQNLFARRACSHQAQDISDAHAGATNAGAAATFACFNSDAFTRQVFWALGLGRVQSIHR